MSGFARAADEPVKTLASSNTAFAIDLFQRLNQNAAATNAGPKNLFFSPYSISCALAMVDMGARNATADQMNQVLHIDMNMLQLGLPGLQTAINGDPAAKRPYELSVANALWVEQSFPIQPPYVNAVKNGFHIDGPFPADFTGNPEAMRGKINLWVEDQTHQKIKDLLPSGSVDNLTKLVLTNAIYFKGAWQTPFNKAATTDQDFHLENGKAVSVPLMRGGNEASFPYLENDDFQAISLPYKGAEAGASELSMIVILPKKADGLAAVEKTITVENLNKWLPALHWQGVRVSLPRFTMTSENELSKPLASLGMADAFTKKADFSGISANSDGKLYITGVFHKAFVDVNEEGTEAAGATGIAVGAMAVRANPTIFRADHPFFFMIRHEATGSILFMGHVMNPKE